MLEKILVVGKNSDVQQIAQRHSAHVFVCDDLRDLQEMFENVRPELIILDPGLSFGNKCELLENFRNRSVETPVVVVQETEVQEQIHQLLELGACDYIIGTNDLAKLGRIIDDINKDIPETPCTHTEKYFSDNCPSSVSIVGKSPAMTKTLKMIQLVAKSACNPVLIVGETGTGKELAARAVHILRHGPQKNFVAVNCAALTANLLESELFGHVKGSFTSADRDKTGLLELAGEGTIFLDEITEIPLELQAKLLRVIQEKNFRKVGGLKDIPCSATIIASSNRNLLKDVGQGRFRSDLYYRLTICPITLYPLRLPDRREDISLLARYFIQNSIICPEKVGQIRGLTKLAEENLLNYHWPGNVRELKNVIERAIMLETTERIGLSNLILNPEHYTDDCVQGAEGVGVVKDFSLEKAEKELVKKALTEAGWQKTRAAALLGITRATLYAKVKQYDIKEPAEKQVVLT